MEVYELNIDGLVGPTHHYAGLARGNLASESNALSIANPQAAALQGLKKMELLHNLGLKQAVLPPHQRPNLNFLTNLGFKGPIPKQIQQAAKYPDLLSASYSASSMWAANAATVSASKDTADSKVHFTAANLISNLHRHQEADFSKFLLAKLFKDEKHFAHHEVLPRSLITADEGAANHSRLCENHSQTGINLFVYGKIALSLDPNQPFPHKYPARQTFESLSIIARTHQLDESKVIFALQNPKVIDEGVFHNDVIAVANESVLLFHEEAFYDKAKVLAELQKKAGFPIKEIEIKSADLSVKEAVSSYLFNSQLLTLNSGEMVIIAPKESEDSIAVQKILNAMIADNSNPISKVYFLDLKQSMQNGGGPACLRLRIPLSEKELLAMHQGVRITSELLVRLETWVKKHYRSSLTAKDLADPALVEESFRALDELTKILDLGSIYPFQLV